MSDCKQCPHDVGDIYQRDCAFPDCIGGWEEAWKQQNEKVISQQAQFLAANTEIQRLSETIVSQQAEIKRLNARVKELNGDIQALYEQEAGASL